MAIGRDGLLYGLEEFTPGRHLRVFDPNSLLEIRRFSLPHIDHRGIAVDADGNVYAPLWSGGEIRKYDSAGNLLTTLSTGVNNLQDIDLSFRRSPDRRFMGGRRGG